VTVTATARQAALQASEQSAESIKQISNGHDTTRHDREVDCHDRNGCSADHDRDHSVCADDDAASEEGGGTRRGRVRTRNMALLSDIDCLCACAFTDRMTGTGAACTGYTEANAETICKTKKRERNHMSDRCLWQVCVPSKTMAMAMAMVHFNRRSEKKPQASPKNKQRRSNRKKKTATDTAGE
jgi:hypothetical protein